MIAHKKRKESDEKMNKKIIATFAVLLIALSVAGFAYAHWSDYVQIEGTVHMGELIVGISSIDWVEDSDDWDKDPCDIIVDLSDPQTSVHHDPPQTVYHTMTVTVDNGYPQYWAYVDFYLKNAGTIPAHVIRVDMTPGSGLVVSDTFLDINGNPYGWELTDVDTGLPALNVYLYKYWTELSLKCNQLEPCTDELCELWLDIKQEGCEECNTYTFSFEIEAIQWNKA